MQSHWLTHILEEVRQVCIAADLAHVRHAKESNELALWYHA
jgi:hypothetical protein